MVLVQVTGRGVLTGVNCLHDCLRSLQLHKRPGDTQLLVRNICGCGCWLRLAVGAP
jgi:hypothetical protein